jgi:hypothetical protein
VKVPVSVHVGDDETENGDLQSTESARWCGTR